VVIVHFVGSEVQRVSKPYATRPRVRGASF